VKRPRLLDLFCGAGGCAVGYHRAGFDVVGVDHRPQPNYPFPFVQDDALRFLLAGHGEDYDAIHASPPCQGYSRMRHLPWLKGREYPLLIEPCRKLLEKTGKPWAMENVEDAPLAGIVLCGSMFGLKVYRHRRFESNVWLWEPQHLKHKEVIGAVRMLNDRAKPNASGYVSLPSKGTLNNNYHSEGVITVGGHNFKRSAAQTAMGIDWMSRKELAQAIPPAYTEYVGKQLMAVLTA
jgi:DNA (cytosine-5)-methyltransferase 1